MSWPIFQVTTLDTVDIYKKRVYTHPVGVMATSHGVQCQPNPSGFSICLGKKDC